MSQKFPMKVVIDEVTTPLLFAKLSTASSPRERAALLRSLAEAGLRGVLNVESGLVARVAADVPIATEQHAKVGLDERQSTAEVSPLAVLSTSSLEQGHDADTLADQFGSYF